MATPHPFTFFTRFFRSRQGHSPVRSPRFVRLHLEPLEDRRVTAVFTGAASLAVEGSTHEVQITFETSGGQIDDLGELRQVLTSPVADGVPDPVEETALHTQDEFSPEPQISPTTPPHTQESSSHSASSPLEIASLKQEHFTAPASVRSGTASSVPNSQPVAGVPVGSSVLPRLSVVRAVDGWDNTSSDGKVLFRISRTPVNDQSFEVSYRLTTFTNMASMSQLRSATLSPGQSFVEILDDASSPGSNERREIVSINLLEKQVYQLGSSELTLFLLDHPSEYSETALFEAFRQGKSPDAFRVLLERHWGKVIRTCYQVLGDWHEAEDVCQIVFLALAQHRVRLQTTLAGWLRTVARNASIALLRSRTRRSKHEQQAATAIHVESEEPAFDLREEIDVAMNQLSTTHRDIIRLRYLEGWSQSEAAQFLGCPRGTLSQRTVIAMRNLRCFLESGETAANRDGDE